MEDAKGIVIPCKHLLEVQERRRTKRVVLVQLVYKEFERMIDCESESSSSTPYTRNLSRPALIKRFMQTSCNPVDCQECKSEIIEYFTSVIAHPNPDGFLADLCTQLDAYIHQGIPSPVVVRCLTTTIIAIFKLGTYMLDIIRDENPMIELVSYHMSNYMERHYLPGPQGQGSDNREWCVNWLGVGNPQSLHPRPCDLNLDKVDRQSLEDVDFTCPICLEEEDDLVALPCRHIFHESCIRLWLERGSFCPKCLFQLPKVCVAWGTPQIPIPSSGKLYSRKFEPSEPLCIDSQLVFSTVPDKRS